MSDDEQHVRSEQQETQQDEVEAHRRVPAANEEAGAEGDDDVEGHATRAGVPKKL